MRMKVLTLPGSLTRLASDQREQRQWYAPASSFIRMPTSESLGAVLPALGRVCLHCKLVEDRKKLLRLADEKSVGSKGLDCRHGTPTPRLLGWANDRHGWEFAAEEDGWLGHDQVGLEVLTAKGRGIEVWEN